MAKKKKPGAQLVPMNKLNEDQTRILDLYFDGGFRKQEAVLEVCPHLTPGSASVMFSSLMRNPVAVAYLDDKRARLKASLDVSSEHLLREQLNVAFSDIGRVIGLSIQELKELPPDVRRTIDSVKYKDHYDKAGNFTGQTVEVKMKDSLKAMEMINKHLGHYSEDNRQKGGNINVLQVLQETKPEALNSILLAMEAVNKAR